MKYLASVILLLLMLSCQKNPGNTESKVTDTLSAEVSFPQVNDEFMLYLDNFKKIDLPLTIKGCAINPEDFKWCNEKQSPKYAEQYFLAFGQIPTNGNYIATLTLGAADCFLPTLTTYKLNGQLIDKQTIAIGGCGSDCGFSCEEFMTLKKDFSFYTSDTISTYTCDSLANEVPGSYEYYVIYKKGKLLTDGKIQISDEIRKSLPGRKNEP